MNRRGFLGTLLGAVAAGSAALEVLAKQIPPERRFSYFDGEKQVTVPVSEILGRFRELAAELVVASKGNNRGEVARWLDAGYVAERLREIFRMKPCYWEKDGEPYHAAWYCIDMSQDYVSVGPTVEDVLLVTNKFFDGVGEELLKIAGEERAKVFPGEKSVE